ncbi:cellulase family glycosylhydrolase [Deinococcus sp.]|uniref:cellulase family glycosylhydrolase n=1 Tax=Deinococcus sp. TaxID=47478 RepID=UPI003CC6CE12
MSARWSEERAWAWAQARLPLLGANYLPSSAVNSLEMWQEASYDAAIIGQELGWAKEIGLTSLRVFLPFAVWEAEGRVFLDRVDRFLGLASEHGLSVMPVLFDDCAFAGREPVLGAQPGPVVGVHNSGWVPSPGVTLAHDPSAWPRLKTYVQDILSRFGQDQRVLAWDLYNEPGNNNQGERSRPLLEAAFAWAREVKVDQPLTAGPWNAFEAPLSQKMFELSDVISFHAYEGPYFTRAKAEFCQQDGRPLLCTEWLHRLQGSTVGEVLPVFRELGVSAYVWGLVNGRTQTHLSWDSRAGDAEPEVWQHDLLRPGGQPYDEEERRLLGRGWA